LRVVAARREGVLPSTLFFCLATFLLSSIAVPAKGTREALAETYQAGDLSGALSLVSRALDKVPRDSRLQLEKAVLLEESGDWEGAARFYSLAAASMAQTGLGIPAASCLARGERWDDAIEALVGFLEDPPGPPDALWELALTHRTMAKRGGVTGRNVETEWTLARRCLEALVTQKPDWAAAQMLLGECDERLGDREGAVTAYRRALALEPSYKKLNARIARLLSRQGKAADALPWYEKAVSVDPGDRVLQEEKDALARQAPSVVKERSDARQKRWEAVTPPQETTLPASAITVRVGLATQLSRIVFRGGSDLRLITPAGNLVRTLEANCDYAVVWRRGTEEFQLLDDRKNVLATFSQRLWVETVDPKATWALHALPTGSGYFFAGEQDRAYRGVLEVHPGPGKGFAVINRVALEAYVAGVLPSEMPPHWHLEALKTQAIAARTDVLSKMGRHNASGFDVCDEVHCQAYRGIRAEQEATNQAVSATAGWVLKNGDAFFPAVYSAQCGGHTQSFQEAWGYDRPVVGVEDFPSERRPGRFPLTPFELRKWIREGSGAYCDQSTLRGYRNFRWVTLITGEELAAKERLRDIGRIRSVRVTRRSKAGWANEVTFVGELGEKKVAGDAVRGVLGSLRSNLVWLEAWNGPEGFLEELILYGGGWGHGGGMCQVGAHSLAKRGWTHKRILKHYYPEASLKKLAPEKTPSP